MCLRLPGLIVLGGGTACSSIRSTMGPRRPAFAARHRLPPCVRSPPSRLPYCRWLPIDAIRAVCSLTNRGRPEAAPVAVGVAGKLG